MNILYIFGNGFDIAQGMATRYSDFYKYLQTQKGSPILQKMQKEIDSQTALWSDMEMGLGQFTESIPNENAFESFYYELSDYLQEYLKKEETKFIPTDELKTKLKSSLANPSNGLEGSDLRSFQLLKEGYAPFDMVDVITLNYTNTIEKILPKPIEGPIPLDGGVYLHNLVHLHGKLDGSIIIGVDNEYQIYKSDFQTNENIKDLFVKKQSNLVMKSENVEVCEQLIRDADVIVLFGVSLGETDLYWWSLIGKAMIKQRDKVLIQHIYNPNNTIMQTRKQRLGRVEREAIETLSNKLSINKEQMNELRNRIFFIHNSSAFSV